MNRFVDAANRHDAAAVAACVHRDFESLQPIHPVRNFRGSAQLLTNWKAIFRTEPGFRLTMLRSAVEHDTVWVELHGAGQQAEVAGVFVMGVEDGLIRWARVYSELVEPPPAPAEAEPAEPVVAQAEPAQAEPAQADPAQADPAQADPAQAEPVAAVVPEPAEDAPAPVAEPEIIEADIDPAAEPDAEPSEDELVTGTIAWTENEVEADGAPPSEPDGEHAPEPSSAPAAPAASAEGARGWRRWLSRSRQE